MFIQQDDAPLRVDSLSGSAQRWGKPGVLAGRLVLLSAGGLSPLLSGDSGACHFAGLALLHDLHSLTGFLCQMNKFFRALYPLHLVQLPDKPTQQIRKLFEIWKQTEDGEDLLCVHFVLEINWDFRVSNLKKKKKRFFLIKKFGVSLSMYYVTVGLWHGLGSLVSYLIIAKDPINKSCV